nr:MAG TPA: hypothetical protein [Caudoviricetes sp.]
MIPNVIVVKRDIVDVGLDHNGLAGVVGDIALGGFDGLCLAAEGAHHPTVFDNTELIVLRHAVTSWAVALCLITGILYAICAYKSIGRMTKL